MHHVEYPINIGDIINADNRLCGGKQLKSAMEGPVFTFLFSSKVRTKFYAEHSIMELLTMLRSETRDEYNDVKHCADENQLPLGNNTSDFC